MVLALAFLLGAVAGLRSMTAPAVVAWAAHLGPLQLEGTPLAILASAPARYFLLAAMIGELVADKLPFTPNRTQVGPFIGRVISGGISGGALAAGAGGLLAAGALAGALGGVAGTLGGFQARTRLVRALGTRDYVVAFAEDIVAVGMALLIVSTAPTVIPSEARDLAGDHRCAPRRSRAPLGMTAPYIARRHYAPHRSIAGSRAGPGDAGNPAGPRAGA